MFLNHIVKSKDDKFKQLISFLSDNLSQQQLTKMFTHFTKEWRMNSTAHVVMTEKDLISLATSKNAPAGRLTRSLSKNYSI